MFYLFIYIFFLILKIFCFYFLSFYFYFFFNYFGFYLFIVHGFLFFLFCLFIYLFLLFLLFFMINNENLKEKQLKQKILGSSRSEKIRIYDFEQDLITSKILNEALCISLCANALLKYMHPSVLSPAMDNLCSLAFVRPPV